MKSEASVRTESASRYLQQLCKHFGHKMPVEFSPEQGRISLPMGECELAVEDGALRLRVTGDSQADVSKLEQVVANHLERFAFREDLKIEWTAP